MTSMYIEGYEIERELDQGGMATVYLALQKSLKRKVALKVMAPTFASDESFSKRFLKEGEIVAQFSDPRIVTVFDIGIYEGHHYLAMEYLPGGNLKKRIEQGLSVPQSISIIKTIASALSYAHKRHIVHRDIKPQNVLFRENGDPVLTDFGIAKVTEGDPKLTKTGFYVGSPSYTSPEQISGKVDQRSDLYSLGVMFYEMLTGSLPYKGHESAELFVMHMRDPIPLLPSHLQTFQPVLNQLLAKKSEERFATGDDFIAALEQVGSTNGGVTASDQETKPIDFSKQDNNTVLTNMRRKPSLIRKNIIFAAILVVPLATAISLYLFAPLDLQNIFPFIQTTRESQVEQLLAEARQLRQEGALEASLARIQEGLRIMPNHTELLVLNEQVQAELGKDRDLDLLVMHYLHKAEQLYREGKMEASLEEIHKGLQVVPGHADLLDLREVVQAAM